MRMNPPSMEIIVRLAETKDVTNVYFQFSYQPYKFSEPVFVLKKLLRFVISMTTCVYGISAGVSK